MDIVANSEKRNAASTIGQVFGGYAAGQFADMLGRKTLLYTAVILSLASSFVSGISSAIEELH